MQHMRELDPCKRRPSRQIMEGHRLHGKGGRAKRGCARREVEGERSRRSEVKKRWGQGGFEMISPPRISHSLAAPPPLPSPSHPRRHAALRVARFPSPRLNPRGRPPPS
eukprot:2672385-Pyramimonas_sp.AAC.1